MQKYSVGSVGIWEKIRRFFAVDPDRSTGVPLNATYRYPAPGSVAGNTYTDPVTAPAGDIAGNPYWERDVRRKYARTSVFKQRDIVGLLTLGSVAHPRLAMGNEGAKQLVDVRAQADGTLAQVLELQKDRTVGEVLGADGLPPLPGVPRLWQHDQEGSYSAAYPCRNFT